MLMQYGLKHILSKGGGVSSLTNVNNAQELFEQLDTVPPDLVIIDPNQSGYFSISDIRTINTSFPKIKLLVISNNLISKNVLEVLECNVQGYVTNQCEEGEVINAIFAIHNGEKFYCNKVINILLDKHLNESEEEDCSSTSLTERESEITTLIAKGFTNKEIAAQLFLSPHTVNTHRKNIMRKLDVSSVSGIILYAANTGLIKLSDL